MNEAVSIHFLELYHAIKCDRQHTLATVEYHSHTDKQVHVFTEPPCTKAHMYERLKPPLRFYAHAAIWRFEAAYKQLDCAASISAVLTSFASLS